MAGMQYQEKTAQENLQHPIVGAVFLCRNPQKKYGKNKNSVYWMKKWKNEMRGEKIKNKKNRKRIEKEGERLETVRLMPAPKAP